MESSLIVIQQMLILFCMIAIGYFVYRKKWISDETYPHLSKLVVNVFNPMLVFGSVLGETESVETSLMWENLRGVVLYYILIVFLGFVGSRLIRPKREERNQYQLMFVFSNVGFMGIPVIGGLFGSGSVIYITFYLLGYNLLLYTYGVALAKRERREGGADKESRTVETARASGAESLKESLKGLCNPGVFACIAAIVVVAFRIRIPAAAVTFFDYMGDATIPLSMMVIGISVARMSWRDIFSSLRMYVFCGVKLLVIPVLCALIFRGFFASEMLYGIFVLMLSMPVGSIVTMISNEYGSGETVCSQGIILTTLLSMIPIPVVALLVL